MDREYPIRIKITRLNGSWEVEVVMLRDNPAENEKAAVSGVVKLTPANAAEVMAITKFYLER